MNVPLYLSHYFCRKIFDHGRLLTTRPLVRGAMSVYGSDCRLPTVLILYIEYNSSEVASRLVQAPAAIDV